MNQIKDIDGVDGLSGRQFEYFTRNLFKSLGYPHAHVTRFTRDGGLDVIVTTKSNKTIGIQCKHVTNPKDYVGYSAIQEAYAGQTIYHTDIAGVLTNGRIDEYAIRRARQLGVKYWDRMALVTLMDISNNLNEPSLSPHVYIPNFPYKIPVLNNPRLTPTAKLIFLLIYNMNILGYEFVWSTRNISNTLNTSPKSVTKAIAQLRLYKIIHVSSYRNVQHVLQRHIIINIKSHNANIIKLQNSYKDPLNLCHRKYE